MVRGRSVVAAGLMTLAVAGTAAAWGAAGHEMVGRIAAEGLPSSMPAFFTESIDRLSYLNPEPDRWRDGEMAMMDEAYTYDHYIDLENVPEGALEAGDRFEYLAALYDAGLEKPERDGGFLPFRILELQQRVTNGFARWRLAESEQERAWIEARILNDAGILGHYVADAANPHHSTIHYNGWAEDAPNPEGYTTSSDFHWQFESLFVQAHVTVDEVRGEVPQGVEAIDDVHEAVFAYILATHEDVPTLYQLEKDVGFDPDAAPAPAAERFAIDRLATGASMLRSLWYTAWAQSEAVAERMREP